MNLPFCFNKNGVIMAIHDKERKLALLEAILFTTTKPLSIEELHKSSRITVNEIQALLKEVEHKYSSPEHGVKLSTIGGYRLMVKEEFVDKVSHLTPHADLSRGLLRVLSIIAYHEPVPQSDIVKIIGNRTYEYVKELEQRGLVKSEKRSRTKMLSTTPQFEEYFGSRKDEIKKVFEETKEENKANEKL